MWALALATVFAGLIGYRSLRILAVLVDLTIKLTLAGLIAAVAVGVLYALYMVNAR